MTFYDWIDGKVTRERMRWLVRVARGCWCGVCVVWQGSEEKCGGERKGGRRELGRRLGVELRWTSPHSLSLPLITNWYTDIHLLLLQSPILWYSDCGHLFVDLFVYTRSPGSLRRLPEWHSRIPNINPHFDRYMLIPHSHATSAS